MKKLSVIVLCVAAMMSSIPASAELNWGLRAGVNFVNNDIKAISTENVTDKDNYTGFFAGPMVNIGLPIGFSIDAAALYSQKGMTLATGDTFKEQSIAVPVMLRYELGLGKMFGIFAQAGPQANFHIGDLQKSVKLKAAETISGLTGLAPDQEFKLEKAVWSINLGAGVSLMQHLQLALNYNIPFTADGNYSIKGVSNQVSSNFKSSTLQLMLTYVF